MTAALVFWSTLGLLGAAAAAGLLLDAMGIRRGAGLVPGVLAAAAGVVSLAGSWAFQPQRVTDGFVAGGGFSVSAGLIALLAGLTIVSEDSQSRIERAQRSSLVALSALGLTLAVQSSNLVTLVLCLEVAGVCGYALVASARSARSAEAATKYFLQGALGTGLLVLSAAIIVALYAPGARYDELSAVAAGGGEPLLLGLLLLVAGLGVKSAAAPLHWWAPDAYDTAPSATAGFLAGPAKLAVVTSMAVVTGVSAAAGSNDLQPLGVLGGGVFPVIASLAVASLVVGSVLGLRQRSFARMLAYSGVAQVGFGLVALASGSSPVTVLYMWVYALTTAGAFSAAEAVRMTRGDWDGSIDGLAGIGRSDPVLGVALSALLVSLAGIPPLVGFWAKLLVIRSAVVLASGLQSQGHTAAAFGYAALVVAALGAAVVSVAYYGNVVRVLFDSGGENETASGGTARAVTVFLAVVVIVLGMLPVVLPFDRLVSVFIL